jgi:hypothetical protein
MIDDLVTGIPNARDGFRLLFSSAPFPGNQEEFTRGYEEYNGYWYRHEISVREGELCPALLSYFPPYQPHYPAFVFPSI